MQTLANSQFTTVRLGVVGSLTANYTKYATDLHTGTGHQQAVDGSG